MNQQTVEELARQVAEAFNANFPVATTDLPESRSEPQSHLQAEQHLTVPTQTIVAAQPSCCHPIPASLASKLPNANLCPACAITRRVKEIQDVQQLIVVRGGIFASKHGDDREVHKTVRQGWHLAKIDLANTVALLEMLVADAQTTPDAMTMLKSALDTWSTSEDTLIKVPGITYVDDPVGEIPTEEDHEVARLMMEVIRLVLEKEMTDEDKAALDLESRPVHVSTPPASPEHQRTLPSSSSPSACPRAEVQLISKPLQHLPTPKPILKRGLSPSSMTSSDPKRFRIDSIATVSPAQLNRSNSSPFIKLSTTITTQPHSYHTFAEDQRRRSEFWRRGPGYSPGVWASQAYEKKADTSYYKKSWEHMERKVETGQKEAEEEKTMSLGLNTVAGAWMGLWWFWKTKKVDLKVWRDACGFQMEGNGSTKAAREPMDET
jgi:hypothetical protein